MIRLGYVECNDVLKSQNGGYFIRTAYMIVAGGVIVRMPRTMRLIEDYIVNNEEKFEQLMKNTPWIERTTVEVK